MAESYVQVAPDSTGKQIDTFTVGAAHRQAIVMADPSTAAAVAKVTNGAVSPAHYGLVTRNGDMTFDAFNRLRVGEPHSQFAGFNEYGINGFDWVTAVAGTGSVTHSTTTKLVTLTTGGTGSGARAVLQTKKYMRYVPGKSQEPTLTFIPGALAATNCAIRCGYHDDSNGVFYEVTSTGKRFKVRSNVSGSVVDTSIEQASWNLDTMDGSGASGITLNNTYGQIFILDLQFLGMGTVRYGFEIGGIPYWCHAQHHSNRTATQPYMATAHLPLRFEIINTGVSSGTGTFYACCGKCDSNGGLELEGIPFSAGNGVTGIGLTTTLKPLVSIRPALTFGGITNRAWTVPDSFGLYVDNNSAVLVDFQIIWNATLTGASWTATNSLSCTQFDVTASAVSLGSGVIIEQGMFASSSNTNKTPGTLRQFFADRPLVTDFSAAASDTLTIAARVVTGTATAAYAALSWHEHR